MNVISSHYISVSKSNHLKILLVIVVAKNQVVLELKIKTENKLKYYHERNFSVKLSPVIYFWAVY